MGLQEDLLTAFTRLKAESDAQQAALLAGRPARVLRGEERAKGHPKVSVESDSPGLAYGVRLSTDFGWLWLIFTCFHCGALAYAMFQGPGLINGQMVDRLEWQFFALVALVYMPFFLIGFALTVSRYRVVLTDAAVIVRWRIVPYLGWTWTLPTGGDVEVRLAYRGTRVNGKPLESIVIDSLGREFRFGALLPLDVKEHLAGLIRDYYSATSVEDGSAAPFISNP